MKRILLTGFLPFGAESVNPAQRVAEKLDGSVIGGAQIVARSVPVVYDKAAKVVQDAILELKPQAVVSLGQAGGATAICVERFSGNLDDSASPDNEGVIRVDVPIAPEGPAGYWATVPVRKMLQAIQAAGIPAAMSGSAGGFLCNHLFYATSHFVAANNLPIKVGFIHIPFLHEQAVPKRNVASMAEETIRRAVEIALSVIASDIEG